MDDLIIRSLTGQATQEEEERLRAWRARNAANERKYRSFCELWTLVGAAAPEPEPEGNLPDVEDLLKKADAGRGMLPGNPARPKETTAAAPVPSCAGSGRDRWFSWNRRVVGVGIAAGLVAIGFGLGTLGDHEETAGLLSSGEIITGRGEMTTVRLGDGTSVRLGPTSRLRFAGEKGRRTAWLEGRAFFGVQADSTRPFVVRTSQGNAKALGTRFEVRAEEEGFRVLVVDGKVDVEAGGGAVSLFEGEMSRSVGGIPPSTQRVDDIYAHLDWLGPALVFQKTPLDRALREINRRYGMQVILGDSTLGDLTVTATFTDRSGEEVIYVLCEIVNAECTTDGDEVRIGDDR